MTIPVDFNIWYGLLGLLPLVVYLVLIFTYKEPIPITILCVVLGALITHQTIFSLANEFVKSLGSFLALVGLIIMMGRGLGEILNATKVSHTLVHKIIYTIGVNTQRKAMAGIVVASIIIVGLLGTMAGGISIIAPIVLPVAASVGLTRSTVATLFHVAGEEGLTLGPFTPPTVTLLAFVGITYGDMLFKAAIPVAIVTLLCNWFMACRIQKETQGINDYEQSEIGEQFVPDGHNTRTTVIFILSFIIALAYGIIFNASTSYVTVVMLGLAIITGLVGGISIKRIFELFVQGMAGNLHLFVLFLLLNPFMNFMEEAGAFKALTILIQPLANYGGKEAVPIIAGLTGTFGLTGATVAIIKMIHDMFAPLINQYGINSIVWAIAIIIATRACNFVHPGANMFSAMGFAQTKDMVSMIKNGWVIAFFQILFLCIVSLLFA